MNKLFGIGLSAILVLSFAPKADAGWFGDIWDKFGGGIKAGGSVNYGRLNHHAFWGFCSSKGYRSYYDHSNFVVCGYDEYDKDAENPNGDAFDYNQVCAGYFGNNSILKDDGTCESQSY
jgi:hypothetical protein